MKRVSPDDPCSFAAAVFVAARSMETQAGIIANHPVEADLLGHDSHGVIRLPIHCGWLAAGKVVANRHAELVVDHTIGAKLATTASRLGLAAPALLDEVR